MLNAGITNSTPLELVKLRNSSRSPQFQSPALDALRYGLRHIQVSFNYVYCDN